MLLLIEPIKAETIDLKVLTYNTAVHLDEELGFRPGGLEFFLDKLPMEMALRLTARLRVPGQVLQDDTLIAEYPVTLWDYIKRALGWRHRIAQVRMNEHLVYPEVQVPDRYSSTVRLWTMPELHIFDR